VQNANAKPETTILLYGVPNYLLRRLGRQGFMLVPTDISWRRAASIERKGWATCYPFHHRWQGKLTITDAGRRALS
jgi:hypothetical protein